MFDRILLASVMCACALLGATPPLTPSPAAACACEDVYDWVLYDVSLGETSSHQEKTWGYVIALMDFLLDNPDWQYQGENVWHVYDGPPGEQWLAFTVVQHFG